MAVTLPKAESPLISQGWSSSLITFLGEFPDAPDDPSQKLGSIQQAKPYGFMFSFPFR